MREIQLRPKIAEHDLQTKIRAIKRLLIKDEVRVKIFFRGREFTHPEIGSNLLRRVIEDTKDIAKVKVKYEDNDRFFVLLVLNK